MKQRILLLIFAGILGSISLSSYRDGYAFNGSDGSGATGSTGCSCHGSTSAIGTKVELDSAGVPVTSYRPGMSYTVKISAANTTATSYPKFGFQLATVKVSGAGTGSAVQAGTWGTPLPTGVKNTSTASSGLPIPFIEHSAAAIAATTGTGGSGTTYVESIPWTAPAAGTGSFKIYGVLLASNGNNSDVGDRAQVATAVTITEAVAPAAVASVSIAITGGANNSCAGASVTFTATPTNGGTAPTYQWKVNGTNAGTGATFSSTTLTNGQVVTCVMTSNLAGVTGNPATSNSITMIVKSKSSHTIDQSICQGQSYLFNGVNRTTSGTYLDTLVNSVGCDSLLTLNLTVKAKSASTINKSICTGQSYFFNGVNHTTAGTFLDTLQNIAGCDSVITLNLSISNYTSGSKSVSICQGQSYFFNGSNLTTAGTYKDTLTVPGGCDSILTLTLTVKSKTTSTINKSICTGQTYFFNGVNHTTAGTFFDTLQNAAGCDSIITLNLSISNYTSGTTSASICQGESYAFNGANLTTAGTYKDTLTVSGSCDSIVTLTLTVNPLPTVAVTQTSVNSISATTGFSSYEWYLNGTLLTTTTTEVLTVSANGSYTVKVTSGGCSAISTALNVQIQGIHDLSLSQLKLYPNPANQQLTVEVPNWNQLTEGALVNIYDILGNVLVSEKLLDEKTTLNIERLQKGIYFARVNDSFVRFVKE
jgi:hypothetical protein